MSVPPNHPAPYVFLSYASADRERALRVAELLEVSGISVWLDRKSITGGTSWSAEIVRGIEECAALVVLCSAASMASPNVQQELQLAWEHRRPILPLRLDREPLPRSVEYVLAGRQWVELVDRDDDWLPPALRALANLGLAAAAPSPPPFLVAAAPSLVPRHNLPAQMTSFIGREKALGEVKGRLAGTRLLTLTGAGGCGKTRLALRVASDVLDEYADGVWLVELAALADETLVPQSVLAALGLRAVPGQSAQETLSDYLRDRQALLLVDNCEHLIGASAQLVAVLLRGCPKLKILATSRELLGVSGEVAWSVPSLALPDSTDPASVESVKNVEAVRLFVERATAVSPGFAVTSQNAAAISQICLRLDGIPLAIELAAARLRGLAVEQIAARLDDRFRLLTGGSRTALRRQQTLRAAVDWSHDLLSAAERAVFRRLSVFAGGWTLEAAEAVCGDNVLDLLLQLVDKSLVLVDEKQQTARYRFLEMIRQYAGEKLLDAGEAAAIRNRHRDWFVDVAERAEPELRGGEEQGLWLDRLEIDHDNLRAALDWSHGQPDDASFELRLAGALGRFWHWRLFTEEGRARLHQALARTENEVSSARALALNWAGRLDAAVGNPTRATELLHESISIARRIENPWLISFGLRHLAMVGEVSTAAERHQLYAETREWGRKAGEKQEVAWALINEAQLTALEQDSAAVRSMYLEALAIAREARDRTSTTQALNGLGRLADAAGEPAQAEAYFREALATASEIGYMLGTIDAHLNLGRLLGQQRRWPVAKIYLRQAVLDARRGGDVHRVSVSLMRLADVRIAENSWRAAVCILASADALQRRGALAIVRANWVQWQAFFEIPANLDAARSQLTPEEFAAAWAEGQAMTIEQAVTFALAETSG